MSDTALRVLTQTRSPKLAARLLTPHWPALGAPITSHNARARLTQVAASCAHRPQTPSPAVQDKVPDGSGKLTKQRLVLGTHTSEGEQNYLMLAEVALPVADSEAEARGYDEERNEVGGFGSAAGRVQARELSPWRALWERTSCVEQRLCWWRRSWRRRGPK